MVTFSNADGWVYGIVAALFLCLPVSVLCAVYVWRIGHEWPPVLALIGLGIGAALFGWQYGRILLNWWPQAATSGQMRPSLFLFSLIVLSFILAYTINIKKVGDYMELQRQFIANVTHELRTPLGIILGFSEIGEAQYIPIIHRNADRMRFLIENILGTAKLEDSDVLTMSCFDLGTTVAESVTGMQIIAARKNVALNAEHIPATVFASEPFIVLLTNNLVHNAIKFTDEGGHVAVTTFAQDGYGVIQVRDTGVGMDEETRRGIFSAFVQGDGSDTRRFNGVGLGLHFVKMIVDAHNGRIDVHSILGEGSIFEVWIPEGGHE